MTMRLIWILAKNSFYQAGFFFKIQTGETPNQNFKKIQLDRKNFGPIFRLVELSRKAKKSQLRILKIG